MGETWVFEHISHYGVLSPISIWRNDLGPRSLICCYVAPGILQSWPLCVTPCVCILWTCFGIRSPSMQIWKCLRALPTTKDCSVSTHTSRRIKLMTHNTRMQLDHMALHMCDKRWCQHQLSWYACLCLWGWLRSISIPYLFNLFPFIGCICVRSSKVQLFSTANAYTYVHT